MAKQNTLQEVKNKMKEMQDAKALQLAEISQKQEDARDKIAAAALAMKKATEEMNVDRYEEAKHDKSRAQTALDMYSARYAQIQQQEYISEQESDKVLDSLLEYETQLEADLKAAMVEPLKKLNDLYEGYLEEVKETERILAVWQDDIHANYSTRGESLYYDEFTGTTTDRSKKPVPIRRTPFTGCIAAVVLGDYLQKAEGIYKE